MTRASEVRLVSLLLLACLFVGCLLGFTAGAIAIAVDWLLHR